MDVAIGSLLRESEWLIYMADFDLSNFLDQYFDEAKERLRCINQYLVLFESGDLSNETLNLLRRQAHTIKGAAQMLGIKDMGDAGHLFEDVMEYMIRHPDSRTQPMVQFLFDLHDQLEKRLEHKDRGIWIDTATLKEKFNKMQYDMKHHKKSSAAGNHNEAQGQSNTELTIDAMGAIKRSISSSHSHGASGIAEPVGLNKDIFHDDSNNFRPDVSQFELERGEQQEGSGNYLRVDCERLNHLSNQIVELSSDRYRVESMEEQFEVISHDLQELKHVMQVFEANAQGNWNAEKRTRVISEVRISLERQLRQTQLLGEELRHNQSRSSIMLGDLRDQVLSLVLRPLNTIFSVFPRTVRDVAARYEKKVQLLVAGESVEMDQVVAEALIEPLIHLLNNAVAHGIETPEKRLQCGKPAEGQVAILARHKAGEIQIEVIDDGRGIDVEQIRNLAIERGIITQTEADEMGPDEILELIFFSGFTTQQKANNLSGRGMGMSIVYDGVRKLSGSIHIHTRKGQGTRFTLSLPVRIAVQQARIFRIGDQRFGMLANAIETVLPLGNESMGSCSSGFTNYKHRRVPTIDLRQALGQADGIDRGLSGAQVLIVEHTEGCLGIIVDEVFDEVEIIVRALDPYLKYYQPVGVMGNAIIADGSVLLLIEPNGIREMWRTSQNIREADREIMPAGQAFDQRVILVDDSPIALQLEKRMLESFGLKVDTAIGGADALEKMRLRDYDLLVTGLEMPGLSGFDLIRQLRAEQRNETLPVLVISMRNSHDGQQQAKEAGADAYLAKQELNSDELLSELQLLLSH
jgi:chemotaxis protein histidine kinase CheA